MFRIITGTAIGFILVVSLGISTLCCPTDLFADEEIVITYEEEEDSDGDIEDISIEYESEAESTDTIQTAAPDVRTSDVDLNLSAEGFLEFESFLFTDPDLDGKDAVKKGEVRGGLELKQGTDLFHIFCRSNLYFNLPVNDTDDYQYHKESHIFRNLTISSKDTEISFNELYINFGTEQFRIRAGNQIFGWGTGDAFNPTAYFNPNDTREMLFKDDDELKQGVPSLSAMFFGNGFTLETVIMPLHVPSRIASDGDFWSLDLDNYTLPIIIEEPTPLEASPENVGYGARITTTRGPGDFSISCYHGPDKDPVYQATETILSDNSQVSVLVKPYQGMMNQIGADCSINFDRLVIQAEAAWSPDRPGIEKQNNESVSSVTFPYTIRETDFFALSTGFNYFIPLENILPGHSGETALTVEYYHADYLSNDIARPFLSDILLFRFQDGYFKNRINISFTAITDLEDTGRLYRPMVEFDFMNGLKAELAFADIDGKSDSVNLTESLFYYLRNNDFISLKVRYVF